VRYLIILITTLFALLPVQAQEILVPQQEYEVLATFVEACRLDIDMRGRLYVVDRGRDVVIQLTHDGQEIARLGGPGGGDGEFDEPTDIDPGIGLSWLVADTGNGRLQRFSQTFLHMETLAVPRDTHFEPGTPNRLEPRVEVLDGGRPVAVVQSPAGEVFAIEESQGIVLKWDKSRRLERAIGGFGAGEGTLIEPVALAVDTDLLCIGDRGRGAVVVYDLFGGYVQMLTRGRAESVQALALENNRLWIVSPQRIHVAETTGRHLFTYLVPGKLRIVDAVPYGNHLYLLTRTQLLRVMADSH